MMYHFIFGFTGGAAAAPSAPSAAPFAAASACTPSICSFFSLSVSVIILAMIFGSRLCVPRPLEDVIDHVTEDAIHQVEVQGKEEDGDDDDGGSGTHFLRCRSRHFAHLGANVSEKIAGAPRPRGHLSADVVFRARCCRFSRHFCSHTPRCSP